MTVRMTEDEAKLRDALADHFGLDGSGVMRMAMLKLAREEGISAQEGAAKKAAAPKAKR